MTDWFQERISDSSLGPVAPREIWWWAVEHRGHPAFYLRALMPGDFAPDHRPLARHACDLAGHQIVEEPVVCGSCGQVPRAEDLEPIERISGRRGFLTARRRGPLGWPAPTDPGSCWLCSDRQAAALVLLNLALLAVAQGASIDPAAADRQVRVCPRCARFAQQLQGRR